MPEVEFGRPPSGAGNAQAFAAARGAFGSSPPPTLVQASQRKSRHLLQLLQLRRVLQPGADGLASRLTQIVLPQAAGTQRTKR